MYASKCCKDQYWGFNIEEILKICTNIKDLYKYWKFAWILKILNFSTKPKNTHLPQVKNFTWRALNRFMPKSGIFEQYERKTQQNYGTTDK